MQPDNVIVNGNEADLLLYGEIVNNACGGDAVLGRDVVSEILRLSQSCGRIRIRINSEGGEVYAGIAIFNAIRNCPCDVVIYTDGISASIAGIVAMCGRKHYMSRHARLMIHSVSAGVYGDKGDLRATIDEIESLEGTLSEIIGARMGIAPEEVRTRYFDGSDHWFTAAEAVEAGLADGIYDIPDDVTDEDTDKEVYSKVFTNRAAIRSQILNDMQIENFKKKPRFGNVMSEDDVLRVIDELNGQIEALESENGRLKERLTQIESEDIEKILEAAVQSGKIEEGEKEDYRKLLNMDKESASKVINSLKPRRSVKNDLNAPDVPGKTATWDDRMAQIRANRKGR